MQTVIIGLTGPTGSGKTTLSDIAKKYGFCIINADSVARDVVKKGESLLKKLDGEFLGVLDSDGGLDRAALAKKAFCSKESTEKLNSIMLPVITDRISSIIDEYKSGGKSKILLDAPTLFEAGADKFCTKTVGVLCDKEVRKLRIIKRDNITEDAAVRRINAGKPDSFYREKCDYILNNNGNIKEFSAACEKFIKTVFGDNV